MRFSIFFFPPNKGADLSNRLCIKIFVQARVAGKKAVLLTRTTYEYIVTVNYRQHMSWTWSYIRHHVRKIIFVGVTSMHHAWNMEISFL